MSARPHTQVQPTAPLVCLGADLSISARVARSCAVYFRVTAVKGAIFTRDWRVMAGCCLIGL